MSYAKKIATTYKILPTKKLGQNFLIDDSIIDNIVNMAAVYNSVVLEIGPGTGNMTKALIEAGAKKVIAVEFDKQCVFALNDLQKQYPNLEIINDDALKINEESLGSEIKIVANLPYNIGSALLIKWLKSIHLFSSITIMLQKEVVDKIIAAPKTSDYSSLSVISQYFCYTEKLFDVPAESFWPVPNVISSVVQLIPRKDLQYNCSFSDLDTLLRAAFSQRRKMLRNNLKSLLGDQLESVLAEAAISPTARAEELSVEQFCLLNQSIKNKKLSI